MLRAQLFGSRNGSLGRVSHTSSIRREHLLHGNHGQIDGQSVAASVEEHVRRCNLHQITESLSNDVDDGVITQQVLAQRTSEANRAMAQLTKAGNA